MTTLEEAQVAGVMQGLERITATLKEHTELKAWRITVRNGLVSIDVTGTGKEAHAWRSVLGGRIFPASLNAHGVRTQHIMGRGFTVDVVGQTETRTGNPDVTP